MIEFPPKLDKRTLIKAVNNVNRQDVVEFVNTANEHYWYWSELKYKQHPDDLDIVDMWAAVKVKRLMLKTFTWDKYGLSISITNNMLRSCHYFDMNFGGTWGSQSIIPQDAKEQYLISSLMEEAISSSQMEGASTTRKIAKEMLRKKKNPRNKSEQMIYNNYRAIQFLVEHKSEPLSKELLLQIHSLMTYRTLEDENDVGRFRQSNDVVVENKITHEIVHTPPDYTEIELFVQQLCDFVNSNSDDVFIHPIIKAIMIHFLLSYMHPFVDGNGRTARALFYWYMLKNGYWLTEYLSISRIIYKSKISYENMFLYTEADEGDMGYFIKYHLRVLYIAFQELQNYINRKIALKQDAVDIIRDFHVNERQANILTLYRNNPKANYSITEISTRYGVSLPTARKDMDNLVEKQLLDKIPINNKKFSYIANDKLRSFFTT